MDAIQFTTVVGPDGLIHPPEGVTLPEGEIEVSVRLRNGQAAEPSKELTFGRLIELAQEIERDGPHDLPSDMAENHDYYAHGKPKP